MRSTTRAAFTLLVLGTLFMLLGWVLPFWFARGTSSENGIYWNIYYGVVCVLTVCAESSGVLKEEKVFAGTGLDTEIELEAISILAIVAFVFCFLAMLLAIMFQCAVCGHKTSYYYMILATLFCIATAAILALIAVILAGVALGDFFSATDIQNAFEFPWSVFFYGLASLLLFVSMVLYIVILNRWKIYRHIYSRDRYYFETQDGPFYTNESKPDYEKRGYYPRDSLRKSSPPRDYPRDDDRRYDYYDYRRDPYDDYRKPRIIESYDRRFTSEYRKPPYYYERYRDDRRYYPYYYNGSRYDRPWHSKVDEVMDEAKRLRASFRRGRDRDRYY